MLSSSVDLMRFYMLRPVALRSALVPQSLLTCFCDRKSTSIKFLPRDLVILLPSSLTACHSFIIHHPIYPRQCCFAFYPQRVPCASLLQLPRLYLRLGCNPPLDLIKSTSLLSPALSPTRLALNPSTLFHNWYVFHAGIHAVDHNPY